MNTQKKIDESGDTEPKLKNRTPLHHHRMSFVASKEDINSVNKLAEKFGVSAAQIIREALTRLLDDSATMESLTLSRKKTGRYGHGRHDRAKAHK